MISPYISVCIPTRNRAALLGEAIGSVLDQSVADLEVVIVDDASTDDTEAVIRNLGDGRVRYYRRERRGGIARVRNQCLSLARGRYIAWLDSDDRYTKGALAVLAGTLDRQPLVGLAHAAYDLIDCAGRPLKRWDWPLPFSHDVTEAGPDALRELALANYITTTTVMARREVYEAAGGFAHQMGNNCEDWELWLRLALDTDFAYANTVVTEVRLHPGNGHHADISTGRRLRAQIRAIDRFLRCCRTRISDVETLERRARAALAVRIVTRAADLLVRGRRRAGAATVALLTGHAAPPVPRGMVQRLIAAARRGDEFRYHAASRSLLNELALELAGSRVAARLHKRITTDPDWESASWHTAGIVRQMTRRGEQVAVIDKWDPTILHLSRRRGRHFPDLRLLPEGYPSGSDAAIAHLEALRRRGVAHLVVPSPAFWWLTHYTAFRDHLHASYRLAWQDDRCVVFTLETRASPHVTQ